MTCPNTRKWRWFRPTPDRCVLSLLAADALLWLSDRLGRRSRSWGRAERRHASRAIVYSCYQPSLIVVRHGHRHRREHRGGHGKRGGQTLGRFLPRARIGPAHRNWPQAPRCTVFCWGPGFGRLGGRGVEGAFGAGRTLGAQQPCRPMQRMHVASTRMAANGNNMPA
jgi:hypothetical protein